MLTGFAQRFVAETAERLGRFGTFASGFIRLEGCLRCDVGILRPPDMHEKADQHENDHEELVKQRGFGRRRDLAKARASRMLGLFHHESTPPRREPPWPNG